MSYIVELETGVWLASGNGDPGRTREESRAERFPSMLEAAKALTAARRYHPFKSAAITGAAEVAPMTPREIPVALELNRRDAEILIDALRLLGKQARDPETRKQATEFGEDIKRLLAVAIVPVGVEVAP